MSSEVSLTPRLTLITCLFAVLEKLAISSDNFAESLYTFLVEYLIQSYHDEAVREHLLSNFSDLFKPPEQVVSLPLYDLVQPLCLAIESNKSEVQMSMLDFSFFWQLANDARLTVNCAVPIYKVMQMHILTKDANYFGVAEQILLKLVSKFDRPLNRKLQRILLEHINRSIVELIKVDELTYEQ